jgi:hypothetical protein
MTLEQLKSLKVGDVVRYTNKEDASHSYISTVVVTSKDAVVFVDGKGIRKFIGFLDQDIEHIASTLTLVEPTTTNELQIILHQIRDLEFDITIGMNRENTYIKIDTDKELLKAVNDYMSSLRSCLADLRKQRDNLLRQNM